MKKKFLVKKDANAQAGENNWIEMNVNQFKEFIKTEEGKNRKYNFAPLLGSGVGDTDYYIETTREEVRRVRRDNNHHAYLKKLEAESGMITVSINDPDLFDNIEQEDIIVDETAFVETICTAKETSREIQKALMMLTDIQYFSLCSIPVCVSVKSPDFAGLMLTLTAE